MWRPRLVQRRCGDRGAQLSRYGLVVVDGNLPTMHRIDYARMPQRTKPASPPASPTGVAQGETAPRLAAGAGHCFGSQTELKSAPCESAIVIPRDPRFTQKLHVTSLQ